MQLGMIGLGRMGANMVRRLQREGHDCVVYDVNPDAVTALAAGSLATAASTATAAGMSSSGAAVSAASSPRSASSAGSATAVGASAPR